MLDSSKERRLGALRDASRRKSHDARIAAECGLAKVVAAGEPISFSAVARAAGVSTRYLRTQADLADVITAIRDRERAEGRRDSISDANRLSVLTVRVFLLERLLDATRRELKGMGGTPEEGVCP